MGTILALYSIRILPRCLQLFLGGVNNYLFVIETLAKVYRFEAITKDQNMSAEERL